MDIFKLSKNKSGQEGRQFRIFLPHGGEASNTLRKKPTKEDKFNFYLQTYYTRQTILKVKKLSLNNQCKRRHDK